MPRHMHNVTPREVEVLRLVAHGLSDKQIARRLGTKTVTVKRQVLVARRKLGAPSRTNAVVLALAAGILLLDDCTSV